MSFLYDLSLQLPIKGQQQLSSLLVLVGSRKGRQPELKLLNRAASRALPCALIANQIERCQAMLQHSNRWAGQDRTSANQLTK
jgi:hypothetical protein